jgi:glycosyltransferase involved in cell wall biosynthesis
VRELCRALAEEGDPPLHLFAHSLARARRDDPLPAARLHRLPIPGRSLPMLARIGLDAARLCGGVSVFHLTDYIHPPVNRATTVLTVHDLAFAADPEFHGREQSRVLMERTRRAAGRAARVICPTHATAEMVRAHLEVEPQRIQVIPFGCDHVPEVTAPPPIGEPYILSLGTVEPRKNHLQPLRAWSPLPAPRPRPVVLGRRGWECASIVTALSAAAAGGGVTWLENADDATVYRYLAHAEVLVYPSRFEGFGFPPLEALALGTPVLAGDTPALREVLGSAAWFADPADAEDLRDKLEGMVKDGGARARAQSEGRRQAAQYRWRDCARAHAELYRSCGGGA